MKASFHVCLNACCPLSGYGDTAEGLGNGAVALFSNLDVIATLSLADRGHNDSLTVSSVCQGGFPVEDSQLGPLQAFEYKE